ncbi:MAG: NADH:flavin oxidoreductase/NADH oxidase [Cycloclasticus sp.]|nr:NADH:flavin oxidoreductase/NADH oxidase [Cycloclasticus sp.]
MPSQKTLLFTPLTVRELVLSNRIMISPMCTYQAKLDGKAHDTHLVHYGQFAIGGAGLIMAEATAVEARGRISAGDLGLWSDEQVEPIKRVVDFVHQQGAKMGVQIAHAGIKASTRPPWEGNGFLDSSDAEKGDEPWQTVGPTAEPLAEGWPSPVALTVNDIKTVLDAWGAAAARANAAGFDVLEIHGAHGYLISEFLSPLTNTRTDEYGGEQGRKRLAREVVEAVRANWPAHKPLFFRMSVIEGVNIGWSIDDSVQLAKELHALGVDLVDCSSGGVLGMYGKYAIPRTPGYQVFLADAMRAKSNIPVSAVGLITQPEQAEGILQAGQADIITIGREALSNPYWPRHAAQFFNVDEHYESWPTRYGWWLDKRAAMVKAAS